MDPRRADEYEGLYLLLDRFLAADTQITHTKESPLPSFAPANGSYFFLRLCEYEVEKARKRVISGIISCESNCNHSRHVQVHDILAGRQYESEGGALVHGALNG